MLNSIFSEVSPCGEEMICALNGKIVSGMHILDAVSISRFKDLHMPIHRGLS